MRAAARFVVLLSAAAVLVAALALYVILVLLGVPADGVALLALLALGVVVFTGLGVAS